MVASKSCEVRNRIAASATLAGSIEQVLEPQLGEKELVVINMPGGGVREIDEAELLWLRKAFDSE